MEATPQESISGEWSAPPVVYHQSNHPLPYFAHQQLDLKYFPAGKSNEEGLTPEVAWNPV
jgi:hypothetical protein